jgi:hypothetical protein
VAIADNGSTDGSQAIAVENGARVVHVPARGYGAALLGGIRAARGRYVIMGDSDYSYDFSALGPFVEKLREGYELVMGNRFRGAIMPGAMPPLHRYLGNPVLTAVGRLFFSSPCGDFHCGLRGFDRRSILELGLQASGMEFASEMVVKATVRKLRVAEVPTTLSPDGRNRPPHLRSWRDGWRHLRFLLLFSPRWLFLYPGFALCLAGLAASAWLLPQPRHVLGVTFDIHSLLFASLAIVVGFQSMLFWIFTKIHGMREGIVPPDPWFGRWIKVATVEKGLILGGVLIFTGLALGVYAVTAWGHQSFGPLWPEHTMRLVIPSATAILIGMHMVYGAFFISVLGIRAAGAPDERSSRPVSGGSRQPGGEPPPEASVPSPVLARRAASAGEHP